VTELSHDDDGFHEIQLSGKQLVFLFMATTVVSVVIFLCGVLVGRGVKGDTVSAAESTSAATTSPEPVAPTPATTEAPKPAGETPLTYTEVLDGDKRPTEPLKVDPKPTPTPAPIAADAAGAKPAAPPSAPETAARPAPAPSGAAAAGSPAPGTWAVQVVALSNRTAAVAVVRRLEGKGYSAFMVEPQPGAPVQSYKVQVGRFSDRGEAEKTKLRLKREEQFEPIVLR
jgi:cell division septation protein DedD